MQRRVRKAPIGVYLVRKHIRGTVGLVVIGLRSRGTGAHGARATRGYGEAKGSPVAVRVN